MDHKFFFAFSSAEHSDYLETLSTLSIHVCQFFRGLVKFRDDFIKADEICNDIPPKSRTSAILENTVERLRTYPLVICVKNASGEGQFVKRFLMSVRLQDTAENAPLKNV